MATAFGDKIRIRLKAYDYRVLDQSTTEIVDTARAHGRAAGRADPAADREEQVDGAAIAARRQEVARAVRDSDAQAPDRHLRADAADRRRADEARPAGGRRRRDQGVREGTQVAALTRGDQGSGPLGLVWRSSHQGPSHSEKTHGDWNHRQEGRDDAAVLRGRHRAARHRHQGRAVRRRAGEERDDRRLRGRAARRSSKSVLRASTRRWRGTTRRRTCRRRACAARCDCTPTRSPRRGPRTRGRRRAEARRSDPGGRDLRQRRTRGRHRREPRSWASRAS